MLITNKMNVIIIIKNFKRMLKSPVTYLTDVLVLCT